MFKNIRDSAGNMYSVTAQTPQLYSTAYIPTTTPDGRHATDVHVFGYGIGQCIPWAGKYANEFDTNFLHSNHCNDPKVIAGIKWSILKGKASQADMLEFVRNTRVQLFIGDPSKPVVEWLCALTNVYEGVVRWQQVVPFSKVNLTYYDSIRGILQFNKPVSFSQPFLPVTFELLEPGRQEAQETVMPTVMSTEVPPSTPEPPSADELAPVDLERFKLI